MAWLVDSWIVGSCWPSILFWIPGEWFKLDIACDARLQLILEAQLLFAKLFFNFYLGKCRFKLHLELQHCFDLVHWYCCFDIREMVVRIF